jgi:hypothetical protein
MPPLLPLAAGLLEPGTQVRIAGLPAADGGDVNAGQAGRDAQGEAPAQPREQVLDYLRLIHR